MTKASTLRWTQVSSSNSGQTDMSFTHNGPRIFYSAGARDKWSQSPIKETKIKHNGPERKLS